MSYDDEGRFRGVQQPKDIRPYVEYKQRGLSLAVDFEDFTAQLKA